jgi:PhnB protein
MTTVHFVSPDHHVITPILSVRGADRLIQFLVDVFDAREYQVTRMPDGRVVHADLVIHGAHVMLGEAHGEPATGAAVNVYVPDVDDTYRQALAAGATSIEAPSDRFYGDRNATVKDPVGVLWSLATHIEDVPRDEIERRQAEFLRAMRG